MNLILGRLKIKDKQRFETLPNSWTVPKEHLRLVGNCFERLPIFNFKF